MGLTTSKPQNMPYFETIQKDFDWKRTYVGGSYALHSFLGYKGLLWEPNDIDVMVSSDIAHPEELDTYVRGVCQKHNGAIMKENITSSNANGRPVGQEDFHRDVFKTYTVQFPGMFKPVQFVGIHMNPEDVNLRDKLTKITDVPTNITYSIDSNGERLYQVPERSLEALFTGRIRTDKICHYRQEKYSERGFRFITR